MSQYLLVHFQLGLHRMISPKLCQERRCGFGSRTSAPDVKISATNFNCLRIAVFPLRAPLRDPAGKGCAARFWADLGREDGHKETAGVGLESALVSPGDSGCVAVTESVTEKGVKRAIP
ncbi:hypothetical protein J8F10_03225 [Gemmata sp. G18]|uniref:Uncharacterized protein n=1 Tax=Gemmata palustris TaxID=2822762 RepID=A0ABS5BKS0_9BACT|nr:hypothetical protein [Gemmata palustris]MBP3954307.1 hypothetical protein [Gemmata palustris]